MTQTREHSTTKRRRADGPCIALWTEPGSGEGPEESFAAHAAAIDAARARGANVVVFGELSLCAGPSAARSGRSAIMRDDPRLLELARRTEGGAAAVVGFVEASRDGKLFNSAAWLEDGRVAHVQRKLLVGAGAASRRGSRMRPGRGVAAIDTRAGRVAILVGDDCASPLLLSLAALDGAATIYVPARLAASANDMLREGYLRSMAHALGIYLVVVERGVGEEAPGRGRIFAPEGGVLADASCAQAAAEPVVLAGGLLRRRRGDLEWRRLLEHEVLARHAEHAARPSRHGGHEPRRGRTTGGEHAGGAPRARYRPDAGERPRRVPGASIRGGDDDESSSR